MRLLTDLWRSFNNMPMWVRVWMVLILMPANFATLAFLGQPGSTLIATLAIAGMAFNSIPLYLERGFTNAMALPHVVFWIPLVGVLVYQLFFAGVALSSDYQCFLFVLLGINTLSLVWDIRDSIDWFKARG